MSKDYDVIIIGGGITGAGTARDCAMRGLKTLLVERSDIATGATGRNHGLLHSGARYAVKDAESAEECIKENKILRRIARHCVEDTKGLFITLPEDADTGYGLDYQLKFIEACEKAGISTRRISPEKARAMEPSVNPALVGAVVVPDGSVDPFRLCSSNVLDARLHGADILTDTEFVGFIRNGNRIEGITVLDRNTGSRADYHAAVTVNAAGIWGAKVAEKAGITISMYPAKGTLLVFGHRVNNVVINRCRKSADGDILVPGDTVSVIGTTSTKVPFEECDDVRPTPDEVALMLREGCRLCPSLAQTRVIRAYSGVRPLVASDDDPTGRSISRGIVCLDHASRDGVEGFITITGGKLMTYRLMAEIAANAVCKKLAVRASCRTTYTPLPGSRPSIWSAVRTWRDKLNGPYVAVKAASDRQGFRAGKIDFSTPESRQVLCECENVTLGEVRYAVKELNVKRLTDLRRRTRLGMGTCQGTYCIWRAAKVLAEELGAPSRAEDLQKEYLQERWKGMIPVGWGATLREMEFRQKVYKEGLPDSYKE